MQMPRFAYVGLCTLVVVAALLDTRAAAEAVQTSLTVDANTTALWLFKEGTGTTSANAKSGGPVANLNGTNWVMGRQVLCRGARCGVRVGCRQCDGPPGQRLYL